MLKLLQYCNYIIIVMQIKLMLLLLLHGFYLAFTKSFASLVSRVVDKPNTQLKSDANDFVNAKNHNASERNLCSQVSTKITAVEEHQGN